MGAFNGALPSAKSEFNQGRRSELTEKYFGRSAGDVEKELEKDGYDVVQQIVAGNGTAKGTVVRVVADLPLKPGAKVVLHVSDGTSFSPDPAPAPAPTPAPAPDQFEQDIASLAEELLSLFGGN